jgi:hypothetical protein
VSFKLLLQRWSERIIGNFIKLIPREKFLFCGVLIYIIIALPVVGDTLKISSGNGHTGKNSYKNM